MTSLLVRLLGFPATLIHGDTLVLDRWHWLRERLPITSAAHKLLDVGCGSGGFTIGAALRGYDCLGLDYADMNIRKAQERAQLCKANTAHFDVCDVRHLDERSDLWATFDIAVCCENIEHILDDRKLMRNIAHCLKPGGRLLLTTPNYHYRAITSGDNGPFSTVEDGGHVRRGYTPDDLQTLCDDAGLHHATISYCSGFLSQKVTYVMRTVAQIDARLAWGVVLPLRILPLYDPTVTTLLRWPSFSICLEAYKPARADI